MNIFSVGLIASIVVFGGVFIATRIWLRRRMYFSICLNALELFAALVAVVWAGNTVRAAYSLEIFSKGLEGELELDSGGVSGEALWSATILCVSLLFFALMLVKQRRLDVDAQLARNVPIGDVSD